ncbi:(d)CMP kinase [Candidatus Nitronereus thalassa]|uniref:Cytidylate kinase n=1 Tax=Candidatus Nitronereus thalassa TaxID=3020898 RepID=A0ABU3KA16_9BACT|nr:(d)CMP kinase [Candidatus Nitronereus thalassa]MDT7043148.1 (d)CMP kinase [Candidatus Nitronereus thalassa]
MKASAQTRRLVITIDGPAGAGKSTTARALATQLGYIYLDTGALYRAVAWKANTAGVDCSDTIAMKNLLQHMDLHVTLEDTTTRTLVDSQDVTPYLRTPEVTRIASTVAAMPEVREWLLPIQQRFGQTGGIVVEGRDMGTRVFPNADVKFFLQADLNTRTARRYQESRQAGHEDNQQQIRDQIQARDARDQSRNIAPLIPATDAVMIDSSSRSVEEVVATMLESISARL